MCVESLGNCRPACPTVPIQKLTPYAILQLDPDDSGGRFSILTVMQGKADTGVLASCHSLRSKELESLAFCMGNVIAKHDST